MTKASRPWVHTAALLFTITTVLLTGCSDDPGVFNETTTGDWAPGTSSETGTSTGASTTSGASTGTTGDASAGAQTTGTGAPTTGTGTPTTTGTATTGAPTTGGTADASASTGGGDASLTTSDGGADAGPMEPPRMDLGEGDGSDVITIGDSWMDYFLSGGGIEAALEDAGKDYRNYSRSGTQFLNGVIPRQYQTAKNRDPNIATVIMTGGGNDILLGGYNCDTAEGCQEYVTDLVAGLDELWTEMSNDGVKDVVYINYARDAGSSPADARPMELPEAEICSTGPIRCHTLETTDLVMGDLLDGIHPTGAANDRIAAAVIELMEQEGMRR